VSRRPRFHRCCGDASAVTVGLGVPAATAAARIAARGTCTGVAMRGAAACVHVGSAATTGVATRSASTCVHMRRTAATGVAARGTATNLTVRRAGAWVTAAGSSTTEVAVRGASTWIATRGAAANLTVRSAGAWITTVRDSAAEVTVLSASTRVATRRATTDLTVRATSTNVSTTRRGAATRMAALVHVITGHRMRVRMPTTLYAATLAMRRASTRTTATRAYNSSTRELTRSRGRGHPGTPLVKRSMRLSVSECRVLMITL
jgi:hypothetical protein